MKLDRKTVQGWAWYASMAWSPVPLKDSHPLDGMGVDRKVILACPVKATAGIANRLPGETKPGWLLLTASPIAPDLNEGWGVEPAELRAGFAARKIKLSRIVEDCDSRWGIVQNCLMDTGGRSEIPALIPAMVPG